MLVIHIDSQKDTACLAMVYEGLDAKVLYNPTSKAEVIKAIQEEEDTVIMLGHGSPSGLFCPDFDGNIIDDEVAAVLQDKRCFGIWCYAKRFAMKHHLKGLWTDMFISNSIEASWFGFYNKTDEQIEKETKVFCKWVNHILKHNIKQEDWHSIIYMTGNLKEDFVMFNYKGIEIF